MSVFRLLSVDVYRVDDEESCTSERGIGHVSRAMPDDLRRATIEFIAPPAFVEKLVRLIREEERRAAEERQAARETSAVATVVFDEAEIVDGLPVRPLLGRGRR